MPPVVLFDWGDTMMRDFHQYSGRMCDWPEVAPMSLGIQVVRTLGELYRQEMGNSSGIRVAAPAVIVRQP
ncbi:hypothetical protein [Desulfoprunum sp.]